jgi:hypothetical protein
VASRAASGVGDAEESRVELSVVVPQYAPMIPTLVPEPFHRDGWIYEENVDGWILACA